MGLSDSNYALKLESRSSRGKTIKWANTKAWRESLVMEERYAHLASEHLASAANRLDAVFQESSYVAAMSEKTKSLGFLLSS